MAVAVVKDINIEPEVGADVGAAILGSVVAPGDVVVDASGDGVGDVAVTVDRALQPSLYSSTPPVKPGASA